MNFGSSPGETKSRKEWKIEVTYLWYFKIMSAPNIDGHMWDYRMCNILQQITKCTLINDIFHITPPSISVENLISKIFLKETDFPIRFYYTFFPFHTLQMKTNNLN